VAATKNDAEAAGVRDPLQKIGVTGVINTVIGRVTAQSDGIAVGVVIEVETGGSHADGENTDGAIQAAAPHMSRAARGRHDDTQNVAAARTATAGPPITETEETTAAVTDEAGHRTHQKAATTREMESGAEQCVVVALPSIAGPTANTTEKRTVGQIQVHPLVREAPPDHPIGAFDDRQGAVPLPAAQVPRMASFPRITAVTKLAVPLTQRSKRKLRTECVHLTTKQTQAGKTTKPAPKRATRWLISKRAKDQSDNKRARKQ